MTETIWMHHVPSNRDGFILRNRTGELLVRVGTDELEYWMLFDCVALN